MRLQLKGSVKDLLSPILITYIAEGRFVFSDYVEKGYSKYDVLVIGASGGKGGDYGYADPDVILFGGAGGGGGSHRKQGTFDSLSPVLEISVGVPGDSGQNGGGIFAGDNSILATNGVDGGASSFGDVCKASGGEGGHPNNSNDPTTGGGTGGSGGIGNSLYAGGGAAGGHSLAIPGSDGNWDGAVGSGGGGGAGGSIRFGTPSTLVTPASAGGSGSYFNLDNSVADTPGHPVESSVRFSNLMIHPGVGGGAKAKALTSLSIIYGSEISTITPDLARGAGLVALLLT